MKKTRMPQRLLSLVLVLMMLISVLPVSAMAAELTPSDPETGLTATDVTNELTDSDRLAIFEENMDSSKVSRSEIPADDEMVKVIVQLDADSLLDVRNRTNASMSMLDFQQTDAAKAQLKDIANLQLSVMNAMESKGIPSSFTFSYTSVVSGFAAQVPYGKIHEIKSIDGVVDVVLCQTYYTDSMGSATLGQALTAAEVAAYSNNTQYQGEGMLIGILDTGLDVNHEAFANAPAVQKLQKSSLSKLLYQISQGEDGKTNVTAYSYAALWYAQKHSSSSLVLLTEDDLYKSGKVPFAFDYADADADVIPSADAVEKYGNDHGTHVAGITAGKTVDADGSVTFAGQSPEAQLAIFKVFSDSTNGASTDTILAALNDALLLDVDVINMSLGSNGGFGREAEGDLTTKYYDLVKSAGILLNCSAGNSYSSSQGGAKGDFTSVSDPDTGIISSSSSYDAALSVASVNANETAAFVTAQGRVPYQDVSGHDFTALLLGNDSSRTYEYVMVPNTGDTADYQGLDVTGKIAVVMRGGLSFEQKQLNAASAGAAGCIIYNNRDGYLLNMAVDNYKIPTVCISLANGQMMEAAQEKTLTVSKTEKGSVAMSDFSSWGIPGSLELKPEITAPGGNIYSLQNGGGYQNMSGTSMASPQVAGMAAVVAQYIRANKLTEKTGLTARALAQSLLMSTAVPMYEDYGEGKYGYYSVMQQGAGLANVGAAVSAGTYIMMDKNANAGAADGKVKVELGDDPARTGDYSFGFTIYNLKDAATSFNLSADFFTQNVFANQFEDGSVVNFEDTWTTDLTSNVTWTVDGQVVEMAAPAGLANCDFNGDGKVTKADGQALLDYVTGVLDSISNKDNADFDNDNNIDTYDAYLFFQQLNKSTVEIPANGSIHVEVNAKVLGLDEYDKASDNAGTYVEGYVYADEVASAEGVKGDSHSIPVLGYYGNWTDPSMFDIGSYLEYHEAKTESRVPYMYAYNKNATKYQALTVQYAGDSGMYYFGGNPYVDETYDPNRAAINPDTTVFARATFSLIRNAADSRATITGENGTVYYDKASGSPTAGAYYYSNGGSWRNAQGYIGINNAPTKAAEGEKITVKVTEAPEYYVTYDAEGNATTNWDALGDGASRTYTAYVDRTEPVLSNVYFKEDVETGTRSLVLTAQDNRYVAAAFLIDYDKMSILDRTAGSPEGAAEGAATDISLDLSKAEGVDHLLVQVADYADNTATYKINLNKEELSGPVSVTLDKQSIKMYKGGTAALNAEVSPFGVKPDGVTWKSSDETVATVNERGIITGVNKGTATITAASIKDPTATASCVVTVQTVDTTLVAALMDTNGDAQFYTWDMEHDTTWKKLVNFETTKSVSASTFDARTGNVYLQDGSFNINKMDLDTGKTLATYPGFEGEIPMWDMEYSLVYSTEAKPMLASVYATYFMSPKPVDNLDLSAFDLGLYLWLFADASYFTAVTSLGANKIDTDKDGVKDTDTELFLALDDAGNIWTMNVYPTVDEKTGKDTWGASFGILESNLANVGYAANPTDDGDLYDSLYATVEGQELVLYLANFTGDASHVYRILLNEDTGKWEAADIGNFGDGVWPATLVGTMYHANEDAAKAVNAAMSKTTVHTAQAVEMTPAQIQRYNGAETQAAKGSLNTAAPVAAVVNLPMGDAAENATASNVTVSADEKTVTVNVLAKDAATNGLFTVDYDAANLTLTNVAFNTQYSSYKDASGKVTLGYVDLNGVAAGSTVATLTFTVKDPTALDKINVTVTETERNDQTVNNAETLTADLHTETETVNAKAATCTEDGYTGDVVCKACGKVITKGEVIPALGHKIELVGAKAATCTEDGYTGDEVCTVCGEIVKKGEVIPALGHKIKLVGAKEPTCTEDGYTGDEVCTICGEIVKKGEVIKATGHQYKDGKCTVCGAADPNYKPAVKTGDESNTALWVLVMASAALLAAAVVVLPRKKHSR